jgi:hypothetical protein
MLERSRPHHWITKEVDTSAAKMSGLKIGTVLQLKKRFKCFDIKCSIFLPSHP